MRYVYVTTVSTFKHRYVVSEERIKELNLKLPPNEDELVDWLMDDVTMERVDEFSQAHIGEQIIDGGFFSEEEMLEKFDKENDYLKAWSKENKISFVDNLLHVTK